MQLPNPIVDFSRLEPLYFVVNLLCFWLKLKWKKYIYFLKQMPDKYIEKQEPMLYIISI